MTVRGGCICLAEDYFRDMLAACAAFRDWAKVDTEEQARNKIHYYALPPPEDGLEYTLVELQQYRPYAVFGTDPGQLDGLKKNSIASGSADEFEDSGRIGVFMESDVPDKITGNPAEVIGRFQTALGTIMDQLAGLSGTAGYLAIRTLGYWGPERTPEDDVPNVGDVVQGGLSVEW